MRKSSNTGKNTFWYKSEKIYNISLHKLYKFLNEKGVFISNIEGTWFIVEDNNNVIKITDKVRITKFLQNHVKSSIKDKKELESIENALRRGIGSATSDSQLNFLEEKVLNIKKDSKKECYLFYKSSWIKVTPYKIDQMDYEELDGSVWESNILEREIEVLKLSLDKLRENSVFGKFLWNISNNEHTRFLGICSIIGYLLHEYQDPAINKAIVLMDEKISDDPNGGTGKGIIKTALEKMRKVTVMDGKNFKWGQFAFQDIMLDTSIIVFEDVKRNFDSERLFSCLTDGMIVERKGQNRFKIPKQDVAKILIITNYVLLGEGNSFERRRSEFELSQYYNATRTPQEEFGHLLFDEWDEDEYNLFDNLMLKCVQLYLKEGLIEVEKQNIDEKRIEAKTCHEFIKFISKVKCNRKHNRKEIKENFDIHYPEISGEGWYSAHKFVKWLKLYAVHMGYKYIESRGNNGEIFFNYFHEVELSKEEQNKVDELKDSIAKSKDSKSEKKNSEPVDVKKKMKEIRDRLNQ